MVKSENHSLICSVAVIICVYALQRNISGEVEFRLRLASEGGHPTRHNRYTNSGESLTLPVLLLPPFSNSTTTCYHILIPLSLLLDTGTAASHRAHLTSRLHHTWTTKQNTFAQQVHTFTHLVDAYIRTLTEHLSYTFFISMWKPHTHVTVLSSEVNSLCTYLCFFYVFVQ